MAREGSLRIGDTRVWVREIASDKGIRECGEKTKG